MHSPRLRSVSLLALAAAGAVGLGTALVVWAQGDALRAPLPAPPLKAARA